MRGVLGLIFCLTSYHVTSALDFSNLGIVFGKHHTSGSSKSGESGSSSAGKVVVYPTFKAQSGGKVSTGVGSSDGNIYPTFKSQNGGGKVSSGGGSSDGNIYPRFKSQSGGSKIIPGGGSTDGNVYPRFKPVAKAEPGAVYPSSKSQSTGGGSSDGNVYPRFKSESKAEPGQVYPSFKSHSTGGGSSDGKVYPRFKSQSKTEPGQVYPSFKSQSTGGGSSDGNVYPRFKSQSKVEPGQVYPTFKSQSSVSNTGSTEAHVYPTFKSQGKLSGGSSDKGRVYPTFKSQGSSGGYLKGGFPGKVIVKKVPGKVLSPYPKGPIKTLPPAPVYPKKPVLLKPLPRPYPKPQLKTLPALYPKGSVKPLPRPYPKPQLKTLPAIYPKGPIKPLPRPYPKPLLKTSPAVYPKTPVSYPKSGSAVGKYAPHTFGYFPGGAGKYQSGYFPTYKHHGYNFKVSYKSFPVVQPRPAQCPFGWYPYGGSCYLFSREKLEWYHAQMKCQYMGGSLVVIDSANENAFIKLVAKKKKMNPGAWIGLNDVLFHGSRQWFWGYGHKACGLFDWFGKEPVYRGYQKHCVSMWGQYGYKWRLFNCYRKLQYICEINPKAKCLCGY